MSHIGGGVEGYRAVAWPLSFGVENWWTPLQFGTETTCPLGVFTVPFPEMYRQP